MVNKKEILMESIDILIAERLKTLKFNCCVEGVVTVDNADGTFDVRINGEISTIPIREGLTLQVNDIVIIMIPNNNNDQKWIDLKRPY